MMFSEDEREDEDAVVPDAFLDEEDESFEDEDESGEEEEDEKGGW